MQRRVKDLFYRLADLPDGKDFCILDAGRSLERVEEEVLMAVEKTLHSLKGADVLKSVEPWSEAPPIATESLDGPC